MKKVIILLAVTISALCASAQITLNVKGGLGYAHCWGDAEGLSGHFVGKIGAGIEKPFTSNWSLMPSLELAWKGAEADYGEGLGKATLDILYIQIPIMAAYRMNINDSWNMTMKAGPYVAFGVYGRLKDDYESMNIFTSEAGGKRFDLGLDLGLDFEYHRFVFGVEYELGFLSMTDGGDLKNGALYGTVGYKF